MLAIQIGGVSLMEEKNINEEANVDETVEEAEKNEDKEFEDIKEIDYKGISEELKASNAKLSDENEKLQNELNAIKERLMRTAAEYENFRKRTAKEKEGIYTDACEDVLKNIFPVLDSLERATDAEGSIEDLKKGIEMTVRQFKDSLTKLSVEEISTDGEFDPNFHNAVMHVEDDKYGKNQIVEVFQKGYMKADKVLRYSMVKVAN